MEPKMSLPFLRGSPSSVCSETDEFSQYLPTFSRRSFLILSSYLRLGLPSGVFPSGFPIKACTAYILK
jgi:hypothetical protein